LQLLTHKQLRVLLRDAIDKEAELRDSITQFITQNRNLKQSSKEERLQRDPYGGGEDEDIPQTAKETSAPLPSSGPSTMASFGAPPPPPPSGGMALFNKTKSSKPGPGDLMADIKNALRVFNLKKTEFNEEKSDKGKEEAESKAVLQNEEAESGTRLWCRDTVSFIDQLSTIIVMDYHMARIIFKIVQKTWITFDAALQMMDQKETVNHETLATIMIECGFYVKSSVWKNETDDEPPFRKFAAIVCPYDLPLELVLKLLKSFIKRNGRNRRGDPLKDDVKVLRQQQRDQVKAREESTQNYWQRQNKDGGVQTDALADIGVVQGYWRSKEQRQVGKLW